MTREELLKFLKIFIFFTVFLFLIINWGWFKGVFDYEKIYNDVFKKEQKIIVPDIKLSEPPEVKPQPKIVEKPDSVEIPKIEAQAPIVFAEGTTNQAYALALKKGVAFYFDSVLPGEKGSTIILGHSAPPGWPKINYDWIFSRLNELVVGDEIFVYYQNREYRYLVVEKMFLKPGQEIPESTLTKSENVLILLSCWPPGSSYSRIAIRADLSI